MVHGVVPGNVISLVKLPSGWMSSGMSMMSPLIFSHTAILIVIAILGRESRSFPFSMAFNHVQQGKVVVFTDTVVTRKPPAQAKLTT